MAIGPAQLQHLFRDASPGLLLYARQWLTHAEAEEVVQDAFVRALAHRGRVDEPRAWLARVVRNGAISLARSASARRGRERSRALFHSTPEVAIATDDATRALDALDETAREIVVLHLWNSLTFEQIAELVDCSSSTAHRRYAEALDTMRRSLDPCRT